MAPLLCVQGCERPSSSNFDSHAYPYLETYKSRHDKRPRISSPFLSEYQSHGTDTKRLRVSGCTLNTTSPSRYKTHLYIIRQPNQDVCFDRAVWHVLWLGSCNKAMYCSCECWLMLVLGIEIPGTRSHSTLPGRPATECRSMLSGSLSRI